MRKDAIWWSNVAEALWILRPKKTASTCDQSSRTDLQRRPGVLLSPVAAGTSLPTRRCRCLHRQNSELILMATTGTCRSAALAEAEPNNIPAAAQKITLPCDISGNFFPAADVDTFEFTATKGDVWWVEVASERLGRPTDPSILVQHVSRRRCRAEDY
jgi:hypothetical protein